MKLYSTFQKFLKEVSDVHQSHIYLTKESENIITIQNIYLNIIYIFILYSLI